MANWNKIAEAFGRAVNAPGASKEGIKRVYESNTLKTMSGDVAPFEKVNPDNDRIQQSFHKGFGEGADIADSPLNSEPYFRDIEDRVTDSRLQRAFDEGFERAVERAKYGNRMKELRDVDISDERVADEIGKMSDDSVREEMIRRLLDENQDISDILQWADDLYNKYK